MPDPFLTLATLGQHAQACALRAQHLAVTLVLPRRAPSDLDAVEAQIQELADDMGALVAALRAELGRLRSEHTTNGVAPSFTE
jgi:hypothetical protein